MIWVIWPELCSISPMAETASPMTAPERSASILASEAAVAACLAPSALRRTVAVIWSRAAAVSSRLAACCSVRRDRSSEAAAISSEPPRMPPALAATACRASRKRSMAALKSSFKPCDLGEKAVAMRWVMSPTAIALRPAAKAPMATASAAAVSWAASSIIFWS